jgi:hypothetical protein
VFARKAGSGDIGSVDQISRQAGPARLTSLPYGFQIITAIWNHPGWVDRTVADMTKRGRGDALNAVVRRSRQLEPSRKVPTSSSVMLGVARVWPANQAGDHPRARGPTSNGFLTRANLRLLPHDRRVTVRISSQPKRSPACIVTANSASMADQAAPRKWGAPRAGELEPEFANIDLPDDVRAVPTGSTAASSRTK